MENGAWIYGSKQKQNWVDNFHTAYVLLSLFRISNLIPELKNETVNSLKTGLDFWLENFFLADGTPKYFDKNIYPVDIHSASAAIAALSELRFSGRKMSAASRKNSQLDNRKYARPSRIFLLSKTEKPDK